MDWLSRLKQINETAPTGIAKELKSQDQSICDKEPKNYPLPASFLAEIINDTRHKVYVATDDEAAKLAPPGAALFTQQEIEAMKGIPKELAEKVIDVKVVFEAAQVEDFTPLQEQIKSEFPPRGTKG